MGSEKKKTLPDLRFLERFVRATVLRKNAFQQGAIITYRLFSFDDNGMMNY